MILFWFCDAGGIITNINVVTASVATIMLLIPLLLVLLSFQLILPLVVTITTLLIIIDNSNRNNIFVFSLRCCDCKPEERSLPLERLMNAARVLVLRDETSTSRAGPESEGRQRPGGGKGAGGEGTAKVERRGGHTKEGDRRGEEEGKKD